MAKTRYWPLLPRTFYMLVALLGSLCRQSFPAQLTETSIESAREEQL